MILKHLLYLQGYEFDEQLYHEDFILHQLAESFREEGSVREIEHMEIIERLESNKAYLKSRE